MKEENINDELKALSESLHALRQQEDGMQVPKDYFSSFEDRIFQQLEADGHRREVETPTFSFWKVFTQPKILMAAAACFALVASVWWWQSAPSAGSELVVQETTAQPSDDIDAYIEENIMDFDPEMLAELESEDLSDSNPAASPSEMSDGQINKKDHSESIENILEEMSEEELEEIL